MSSLETLSLVLALALAAPSAPALAWSENFNGEFQNAWTFGFLDDVGDPPDAGSFSASATNDILLISASDAALADGGGGPAFAFGYVDQTFGTSFVRGSVNVGSSPSPVNQLALVARGNASNGTAYLFGMDFDSGVLLLGRSDSVSGDVVGLASGTADAFLAGQSYWLELDAVGSQITGRAYTAAGGTLLDTLSATDATYSQGVAGVIVQAYDLDGVVVGAPLRGTFDDLSAVPEPSSAALLAVGLVLLGGARARTREGSTA